MRWEVEWKVALAGTMCLVLWAVPVAPAQAVSLQPEPPPVQVQGAWVQATLPGQVASGAFMTLTAPTSTRLVAVSSPVAGVADVHVMKMDGNIMRMRALEGGLDLPAGKAVELKPGLYHIMLMDLKKPLSKGSAIAMTLVFKDAKGKVSKQTVKVPVAMAAPAGTTAPDDHGLHGH